MVKIKFRPKDENIGLPIKVLSLLSRKTEAEDLDKETIEKLKQESMDKISGGKELLNLYTFNKLITKEKLKRQGEIIHYRLDFSNNGWFELYKLNYDYTKEEVEEIKNIIQSLTEIELEFDVELM